MNMRRNIVTTVMWFGAAAIFTIHVMLQHRKSSELSEITEVKTKRMELENSKSVNHDDFDTRANKDIDIRNHEKILKKVDYFENDNLADNGGRHSESEVASPQPLGAPPQQDSGSGSLATQNELEKAREEVDKLKNEVSRLVERERKFKNLARRLATQIKGKVGGMFPKLDPHLPWIFAITPTYARFTQKADLVRLAQTLLHVTNLHWLLVEDSTHRTDLVSRFLQESGISFTHLNIRTPSKMQRKKGEKQNKHHRGVFQRNLALQWLRNNVDAKKTPGVVYFMDDDNTYHRKIFDEMRRTRRVSIWGVGLAGGARWSGPVVKKGKVVGFHTNWAPDRTFPIDMAGFSVSLSYLLKEKRHVMFDMHAKRGYLEPTFLSQLTTIDQLEPLADNCTKIYVWHTRTEVPKESIRGERALMKLGKPSDLSIEV